MSKLPSIENKRFWIGIILVIKLILAVFFYFEVYTLGYEVTDGLLVKTGDTFSYFEPMKTFLDGNGSLDSCRMPALVPVYALPYWLFGESFANNFIIILQFAFSILSVYVLGKITLKITFNQAVAKGVILLYAISTFTSVYDIYAIADSLSISTLIFGLYFFMLYFDRPNFKLILISGGLLAWSIFFRQVAVITLGIAGLYMIVTLIGSGKIKEQFKFLVAFGLPAVFLLGSWTLYNKSTHDRFIPLVKPVYECYSGYPKHQLDLLNLPISWGGIFTKWNGEGEWFTNAKMKKTDFPFANVFTDEYNLDSLENLRQLHFSYFDPSKTMEEKLLIAETVSEKSIRYRDSYKKNYPLNFWVVNRFLLFKKFLFPKMVEKLPLPPKDEMNIFEKMFKVGYLLLLWIVNFFGLIGLLFNWKKFNIIQLHIWSITIFLGLITGWVEQRYYAPVYPFMLIYAVIAMNDIILKIRPKQKLAKG